MAARKIKDPYKVESKEPKAFEARERAARRAPAKKKASKKK